MVAIKRILLIGNHFHNKSYNQNAWQELATQLQKTGTQIITTSGKTGKLGRLADMLWTIWHDRKQYDAAQVDVFSGPAFTWAYLSGWLLRWLKKPFILTLRGGNLPIFSDKHPQLVRILLGWANRVTSPSTYLQQQLSVFRVNIDILPNALDLQKYTFRLREHVQPRLVWMRAFHKIYNPSLAPRVLRGLKDRGIIVHLLMAGPDKGDGSLQQTMKTALELGVSNLMEFPGRVEKSLVPDSLSKGDIFINTTNYDNTPVSVLEAMACGLCVVSTNVGGLPFLLDNEVDALLVPPDDPNAMANAVQRILQESGLAGRLTFNARKKVEQFDWSVVLPKWETLFGELIRHG